MQLEDIIISENCTVLQAMQHLDTLGCHILLIAPDNILKAVVGDGDIRRFILAGGKLDECVSKMANYNPKSLNVKDKHNAKTYLAEKSIDAVPILADDGQILDVVFISDVDISNDKRVEIPVVIMAGGLGTRLYPYTKILPKPLIPIGELPIVEHIINRFSRFGCKMFNLIVNYKKSMIKSYFGDIEKSYIVDYTDEDVPLGTGGGLSLLKGKINETFFLTNCDVLIDADYGDIYNYHKQNQNVITMVCAFKNITIPYGVIDLGQDGEICKMTEKPQMNFLTNTGMYIVEPFVIQQMEDGKAQGFTDVIEKYRVENQKVGVYPIRENQWMDMGQLEELEDMRRKLEKN